MAVKTFIPTLIVLVRKICLYNARYGTIILAALPPQARTAYNALSLACVAFIEAFGEVELNP